MPTNGLQTDMLLLRYIEIIENIENKPVTHSELSQCFETNCNRAARGLKKLLKYREIRSENMPNLDSARRYYLTNLGREDMKLFVINNEKIMKEIDELVKERIADYAVVHAAEKFLNYILD